MGGRNSKLSQTNDDNLETYSLIWLDPQVNKTEDNRQTQVKLRQIINHVKTFDDQQQCYKYILSLSPQSQLVLIISGRCGRQLIPQIHHLRQLTSAYVYCIDKKANEQWAKNFTKIKSVIVELDDLIKQIKKDQVNRIKIEEPLSIHIFAANFNPEQSTTGLNGHFVHSLLLIDALIRMKSSENDKQQLITLCKQEYKDNNIQLALIREFENEYSADKALWWYSRDSFLYRMLNQALRVQNIDLLFLFHFVIADIYQQLKENQCQSYIQVYRYQVISNDELDTLRRSIGDFISINSFFSTSINRQNALGFLNSCDISHNLHRILFIIDADHTVVTSKPFANISAFSDFSYEDETLFMIGCVFRLVNISRDDNEQIWVIRMKLCGDSEHDLRKLFDHLKKEYGGGDKEVNLLSFGDILRRMGKYDLAEKMYHRLLSKLSSNDPLLSELYYSLGIVTKEKGEYNTSLQWFHKSLEIRIRKNPSGYINISNLYNLIGIIHYKQDDNNTALEYYNKAIKLYQRYNIDGDCMADFYNNIAIIYDDGKKYLEALKFYEKSLAIDRIHRPSDHPNVAKTKDNIGRLHLHLHQYNLSMQHHEQALKSRLKSLPLHHPDLAISYKNIGLVHEGLCEWKKALTFYQKAASIRRYSLSAQHPDLIEIEKDIKRVSSKLN